MCECGCGSVSVQVCECEYASASVGVQACECASVQVCECASVRVWGHAHLCGVRVQHGVAHHAALALSLARSAVLDTQYVNK